MRILLGLVVFAAALYGLALGALYLGQRWLLFPASAVRASAGETGIAGLSDLALLTADGERLVAWWKPPEPGRALLLYFHGNGGSLWNRRERARALTRDGRGILLVSYRGYSGSSGRPSEDGLRLDAEAAYAYLATYDPARIVVYGESLGSAVAVGLAAGRPVGGLILDSPFTSTVDVAARAFPIFPVRALMRDPFRSDTRIGNVRVPLLVLHGDRDRVVPFDLGERLFALANEPKRFRRLPGVGHEDALEEGGLEDVRAFLAAVEASVPKPAP